VLENADILPAVPLLLLVRHAVIETTGRVLYGQTPGLPLSATGRRQAEAVAGRLAALPISAVYTSPLERCLDTARPIAAAHGLRVRILRDLVDSDAGTWTGRSLRALHRTKAWREIERSPSTFGFPGGERLEEVQRRAVRGIGRIVRRHPQEVVAAVTHSDVIRVLLAHFAGIHLDHFERIAVHPASVSAVALPSDDRPPTILRVNDTGHLDDLVPRKRAPRKVRR
jgi:probable phosphoglycerate mutase